ncbi:MAG: hypothetical protein COA99_04895 [Moraxellaceae bacterium]|nr:MAG: hypothetical protein COA99_04895 [Moraxellaceae bacterium]
MTELTQWLSEHQDWILLATLLLAFFESLALVGIIIPGVALLFAAAAAAGSASINLSSVLIAGFIGAVLGDGISFLLGRHYHETITKLPPFNKHPEWINKGEVFFEKYGIASIVIGRFIGPIRPVMPLVAGMLEMPAYRFFTINIMSALAWSPFYLLPGYFIGAAAETQQLFNQQHAALFATLILIPWFITWCIISYRKRLIRYSQANSQTIHQTQTTAIAIFIGAMTVFILTYLLRKTGYSQPIDSFVLETLIDLRRPFLDYFFVGITLLGYALPMVIWAAAITLTLLIQKNIVLATLWVSATLTGYLSTSWLKNAIAFNRPDIVQLPPTSFSFPSGHTTMIIIFTGMSFLLVHKQLSTQSYKYTLLACSSACALVACSRVYLGVHWATDILAGICLGLMVLAFFYGLSQRKTLSTAIQRSSSPKTLLLASGLGIFCAYVFTIAPTFGDDMNRYTLQTLPSQHE